MKENKDFDFTGTSYHGDFIKASFFQLTHLFGLPSINSCEPKVNYEWELQSEDGISFTLYDWKYYRPLLIEEAIEWNIGTDIKEHSKIIKERLDNLLK
jgi:hypothetical protein